MAAAAHCSTDEERLSSLAVSATAKTTKTMKTKVCATWPSSKSRLCLLWVLTIVSAALIENAVSTWLWQSLLRQGPQVRRGIRPASRPFSRCARRSWAERRSGQQRRWTERTQRRRKTKTCPPRRRHHRCCRCRCHPHHGLLHDQRSDHDHDHDHAPCRGLLRPLSLLRPRWFSWASLFSALRLSPSCFCCCCCCAPLRGRATEGARGLQERVCGTLWQGREGWWGDERKRGNVAAINEEREEGAAEEKREECGLCASEWALCVASCLFLFFCPPLFCAAFALLLLLWRVFRVLLRRTRWLCDGAR